jgi:[ribosomal protein S18]-alanine N-acetyltransferase
MTIIEGLRTTDASYLQDCAQIIKLDQQYFPYPWKSEHWHATLADSMAFCVYVKEQGVVLGFCLFHYNPYEEMAHLLKIVLHPSLRSQGLAPKLHERAVGAMQEFAPKQLYLEVATNNASALKLYHALGYQILNEIKAFYSDGAAAYTMHKCIN